MSFLKRYIVKMLCIYCILVLSGCGNSRNVSEGKILSFDYPKAYHPHGLYLKGDKKKYRLHVTSKTKVVHESLILKKAEDYMSDAYFTRDDSQNYSVSGTVKYGHMLVTKIKAIKGVKYFVDEKNQFGLRVSIPHEYPETEKLTTLSGKIFSAMIMRDNYSDLRNPVQFVRSLTFKTKEANYNLRISAYETLFPGFFSADEQGWLQPHLDYPYDESVNYEITGIVVANNFYAWQVKQAKVGNVHESGYFRLPTTIFTYE